MTLIGIDYGSHKSGLAKEAGPLAVPAWVFPTNKLIETLLAFHATSPIDGFVIGRPDHADGRISKETESMRAFVGRLKKAFPGKTVHEQDERYSSQHVFASLENAWVPKKHTGYIDDMAATIILQDYLDQK